jgi:hypothetical protein
MVCIRLETDDAIAATRVKLSARQEVQIWRKGKILIMSIGLGWEGGAIAGENPPHISLSYSM